MLFRKKMKLVSISGINLTPQGTFLSPTMTRYWGGMERAVRPEILETTKVPRKTKAPALNALTRSLRIYPSNSRNRSRSLLKISKWRLSSINKKSCSSHSISVFPHSANWPSDTSIELKGWKLVYKQTGYANELDMFQTLFYFKTELHNIDEPASFKII